MQLEKLITCLSCMISHVLLHILTTEHKSEIFKFIVADISTSYNNTK